MQTIGGNVVFNHGVNQVLEVHVVQGMDEQQMRVPVNSRFQTGAQVQQMSTVVWVLSFGNSQHH